jgi:hypothetical protein
MGKQRCVKQNRRCGDDGIGQLAVCCAAKGDGRLFDVTGKLIMPENRLRNAREKWVFPCFFEQKRLLIL